VAATWPASADLGPPAAPGPEDAARFLQALPDFDQLSHQARQFALSTGLLRVSLARLLSRWRPEVAAFLLPCGQFLLPSQMTSLPPAAVSGLSAAAQHVSSRALTTTELALLCATLASCPLHPSTLGERAVAALAEQPSALQISALALLVAELAALAPPEAWAAITLAPPGP